MATRRIPMKTSGDGQPAGDWTQTGDGTDYPSETSPYTVLRPLNHDHKVNPEGSIVYLTDEQAVEHLLHQVIKPAVVEVPLEEVV